MGTRPGPFCVTEHRRVINLFCNNKENERKMSSNRPGNFLAARSVSWNVLKKEKKCVFNSSLLKRPFFKASFIHNTALTRYVKRKQ
jgi:hypothetical protein